MLIGYARVSTHEQALNLQQDALHKAGCDRIFTDTASGAKTERMGLEEALKYVRKGDTLPANNSVLPNPSMTIHNALSQIFVRL
jgi:DNA invertase Pin-like site-specific DNA recombinase